MIAVVIPCYKVKKQVLDVIKDVGTEVHRIYVVDDCCPEQTGKYVQQNCMDKRVEVLFNERNLGVGGAVKYGYRRAMLDNYTIVVKLDGDGQVNPQLIPRLIMAIQAGEADYVKGNRFFSLESLAQMPYRRLIGNSILSLVNKFVNGYWTIMDPTNGFTAIHCAALKQLPMNKIDNGYFFESDVLFRLGLMKAVVDDFAMDSRYSSENSSLNIGKIMFRFPLKYLVRYVKRICYQYYLHDFNPASVQLILGVILLAFGGVLGIWHWRESILTGIPATSGTVMLAALPVIIGFQLLLSALYYDIQKRPEKPLQKWFR
ncbi:MAG: glycosyltransferase [Bacteroidales bacterium]|nr:glycosyltransferase [Bacteroidales bacterium]